MATNDVRAFGFGVILIALLMAGSCPAWNNFWEQPAIEKSPMGAEPNYIAMGFTSVHYPDFPGVWFDEWNWPHQCHGDADGQMQCMGPLGCRRVYIDDLWLLVHAWTGVWDPCVPDPCGTRSYNAGADFTRDGRVDYFDILPIVRYWHIPEPPMGPGVPGDCPSSSVRALLVADDFRSVGQAPVTSIDWWGTYDVWTAPSPPASQPVEWHICFWDGVVDPQPGDSYSGWTFGRPTKLLKKLIVPAVRVSTVHAGSLAYAPSEPRVRTVYKHSLELRPAEYFLPAEHSSGDAVFWLSILAVYEENADVLHPWGWMGRPWHWKDAPVVMRHYVEPEVGTVADGNWIDPIYDYLVPAELSDVTRWWQDYWDLAFVLGTDPNWIKWDQPFTGIRQWAGYEDIRSYGIANNEGQIPGKTVVAGDDWLCTGKNPVTGVIWWGSYIGLTYHPESSITETITRPDHFLLSIWTDIPADAPGNRLFFSHPGHKLWEYKANEYEEVMAGYDRFPADLDPCEPVFRYSVGLPQEAWFYQRDVNNVYWLRIVAVFDETPSYEWGWTNHEHAFNDYAVTGGYDGMYPAWARLPSDLSFVLLTRPDECAPFADYNFDCIVDHRDLNRFCQSWLWEGLPGGYSSADMDCDGDAQFDDLAIFALGWLDITPTPAACPDNDGDGFGNPASHCCPEYALDCNDTDANVYPGATEICTNEKDDDCDGDTDCDDSDCKCVYLEVDGLVVGQCEFIERSR
ncbi:MAG: putative metal-binding motif-containing protein [Planctomycetota bacterium]|jgi:hypothetical protein